MKTSRHIFKSSAVYGAGTLFEQICGLIAGFAVAKLLGPHIQGIWQTARLFRTYSDLSSLGYGFGMRREVAVAIGAGDSKEVEEQRDTGFIWHSGSMLVAAAVVALIALRPLNPTLLRHALFGIAVVLIATGFSTFFSFWYKTIERFGVLGLTAAVGGITSMLSIALVYWFGLDGAIGGYVLAAIAVLVVQALSFRWAIRLHFSVKAWKRSFALGFPLWLSMVFGLLFASVDRVFVISLLGFSDMGFYSVSNMCFMPVQTAVGSLAVVLLPRVCRQFGVDRSPAQMSRYFLEPLRLLMVGLAGLAGLTTVMLPMIVHSLLPGYEGGIRAAQIVMIGLPFGCAAAFLENVLVASARTWWIVAATGLASMAKLVLVWLGVRHGLVGVAWAATLASAVYFGILFAVTVRLTHCQMRVAGVRLAELLLASGSVVATWCLVKDIRVFWPIRPTDLGFWLQSGVLAAMLTVSAGVTWVRLRGVVMQK